MQFIDLYADQSEYLAHVVMEIGGYMCAVHALR